MHGKTPEVEIERKTETMNKIKMEKTFHGIHDVKLMQKSRPPFRKQNRFFIFFICEPILSFEFNCVELVLSNMSPIWGRKKKLTDFG